MKRVLQRLLNKAGFAIVRTKSLDLDGMIPEIQPHHRSFLERVRPYTMGSTERLWALASAVEYVNAAGLPGDIVECGVWRGGNMLLARMLCDHARVQRTVRLYDTFAGMSEPTAADREYFRSETAMEEYLASQRGDHNDWCYASLDDVRGAFATLGLDTADVRFIQGKVEDTLAEPANLPEAIAVLRLDTDWYESTRMELEVLYPRLVRGGVLIIDDYGHWDGARKAVDEYFAGQPILLSRIDYTGRMMVKP